MTDPRIIDTWSESRGFFELVRPDWHRYATCLGEGTDIFFHERYTHAVKEAKKLCAICVVRQNCLDFAIRNECVGVWGGMTTQERKVHIRNQRRINGPPKQSKRYARRIRGRQILGFERASEGGEE